MLLGIGTAVAVAAAAPPGDRTFATISEPTQSLMSVTVPFLGVLVTHHLVRRPAPRSAVVRAVLAAQGMALAVGTVGVAVCAVVTATAPSTSPNRWQHVVLIAVGSLLVQGLAQLTGTGFGLLVRSTVLACLATIVVPLGLRLLLEAVQPAGPASHWLTPSASAERLLVGQLDATNWLQWLVVVTIWGLGLNAAGAWRVRRRAIDR